MFHIQKGMHQPRAVLNCGEIMIDSAADETISKQEGMKMRKRILRDDHIAGFREYLSVNEKSTVTISKYTRDAARFMEFAASRPVDKKRQTARQKQYLVGYEKALRQSRDKPIQGVSPQPAQLFARTFYSIEKDIARLADILGHGSIDTTRIYIMATGREHKRKMERTGLVT